MKNIIAFAGSNSKDSINKKLVVFTTSLLKDVSVTVLDLNNFNLPMYGVDIENEYKIPPNAHKFLNLIKESDGIILSLAEHNGSYTVAFKNLFDWLSRIESKLFFNKPMLLMATSSGARGGASVLDIAKTRFPYHNANIVTTFSLPSFNDHFIEGKITNTELLEQLNKGIHMFEKALLIANSF